MPQSEQVIEVYQLSGGLQATVTDETRHYFGGYYHVRITVSADVPVSAAAFSDPAEQRDAVRLLGDTVRLSRSLEKMAVPADEIEAVRRHLLTSFETTVLPYLRRDDFAAGFVLSEYRAALKKCSTPFQR